MSGVMPDASLSVQFRSTLRPSILSSIPARPLLAAIVKHLAITWCGCSLSALCIPFNNSTFTFSKHVGSSLLLLCLPILLVLLLLLLLMMLLSPLLLSFSSFRSVSFALTLPLGWPLLWFWPMIAVGGDKGGSAWLHACLRGTLLGWTTGGTRGGVIGDGAMFDLHDDNCESMFENSWKLSAILDVSSSWLMLCTVEFGRWIKDALFLRVMSLWLVLMDNTERGRWVAMSCLLDAMVGLLGVCKESIQRYFQRRGLGKDKKRKKEKGKKYTLSRVKNIGDLINLCLSLECYTHLVSEFIFSKKKALIITLNDRKWVTDFFLSKDSALRENKVNECYVK